MSDVDDMTADEIEAELKRLAALAESGKITAKQAMRMEMLRMARWSCQRATRAWFLP